MSRLSGSKRNHLLPFHVSYQSRSRRAGPSDLDGRAIYPYTLYLISTLGFHQSVKRSAEQLWTADLSNMRFVGSAPDLQSLSPAFVQCAKEKKKKKKEICF